MSTEAPFMAWIDHLHEVGEPIRCQRAKLLELAQEAAELEWHAAALRARLATGQTELLRQVMRHWTLADIQAAAEAARRAHPVDEARAHIEDTTLRAAVANLDGWHLASEALRAFHDAGVLRQHNLLNTATDEERLQTLQRVVAWWNFAAQPVYERLTAQQRRAARTTRCAG